MKSVITMPRKHVFGLLTHLNVRIGRGFYCFSSGMTSEERETSDVPSSESGAVGAAELSWPSERLPDTVA